MGSTLDSAPLVLVLVLVGIPPFGRDAFRFPLSAVRAVAGVCGSCRVRGGSAGTAVAGAALDGELFAHRAGARSGARERGVCLRAGAGAAQVPALDACNEATCSCSCSWTIRRRRRARPFSAVRVGPSRRSRRRRATGTSTRARRLGGSSSCSKRIEHEHHSAEATPEAESSLLRGVRICRSRRSLERWACEASTCGERF